MNLKQLLLAIFVFVHSISLSAADFKWDDLQVEYLPAKVPGQVKNLKKETTQVNSVFKDNRVTILHLKKEITFAPHQSRIYIKKTGEIAADRPSKNYCILTLKPGVKLDAEIFSHEAQGYPIEAVVRDSSVIEIFFKSTTFNNLKCYTECSLKISDLLAILEGEYFGLTIPLPEKVTRKNSQENIAAITHESDPDLSLLELSEMEQSETAKKKVQPSPKPGVFNYFKKK